MSDTHAPRPRFFAPLPTTGLWTHLALTRDAFLGILGLSVALFLLVPTPVWGHLREGHLLRLALSYGIVPILVALAQARRGTLALGTLTLATLIISLLKLVITTAVLVAIALARS